MIHKLSSLIVTFLVLMSALGLGFTGSSQSSKLEDPYGLLGLKIEYEYPNISMAKYKEGYFSLPMTPEALFLAKYNFLMKEILSPDKKWYSYFEERFRFKDDPLVVSIVLRLYVRDVVKDPRREGFYYRFSWHVVDYDGSYYTVVLRLKMYYYDFVNKKPIYEFSEVVETVKVSVYDRRIIYNGVDVGVWPFWLMPWERYEGARVKLAEISPYFELNNVTNPLKTLNVTLDATVKRADLDDALKSYYRDEIGVSPARVLRAVVEEAFDPTSHMYFYRFTGEAERIIGEPWIEAYMKMARKYYPQLRTNVTAIWGKGTGWILFVPNILYDSVTGVALTVWGINDVFLMVMPSPLLPYFDTFQLWVITKEPVPPVEKTTETTAAVTTIPTLATTPTITTTSPATSPVENRTITQTVEDKTVTQTVTTPTVTTGNAVATYTETTTTPVKPVYEKTTPTTPPPTLAKPPEPRRVEEASRLLSLEVAIAALTIIVLAVSTAILILASRRGARS